MTTLEPTMVESRPVARPRSVSRRGLIFGGVTAAAAIAAPTILLWPDSKPDNKTDGKSTKADGSGSQPSTEPYATLSGHEGAIEAVIFVDDGKMVATGGADKTIRLWKVSTGEQVTKLTGHTDGVTSLCYDIGNWNVLGSGGRDGTARLWDLEDNSLREVAEIGNGPVTGVAYNTFEDLACGLDNGDIQLWHVNLFFHTRTLTGHTGKVTSVASSNFYGNGDVTPITISGAAEGKDSAVRIWNMKTGKQLAMLTGHEDDILHVASHEEGGYVASASKDKTVRIWDPESEKSFATLTGHTDLVYGVAFDYRQETLASGSADGTVRLWKVSTGEHLKTLTGGPKQQSALAFSDDGKTVVAGDKLWRVT